MYLLHRKKIDIYANISLFVSYSEVTAFTRSDGGSAPRDDLYSPERQWRTRTPRWAPETDPQWGPRHLDSHQDKTSGTRWALQSDLQQPELNCCVVWPEEKWPPDWAWFLPRFFSPFCHQWSFGSLPLSPLACLVGTLNFQQYRRLDWTETFWTELSWTMPSLNSIMKCLQLKIEC